MGQGCSGADSGGRLGRSTGSIVPLLGSLEIPTMGTCMSLSTLAIMVF